MVWIRIMLLLPIGFQSRKFQKADQTVQVPSSLSQNCFRFFKPELSGLSINVSFYAKENPGKKNYLLRGLHERSTTGWGLKTHLSSYLSCPFQSIRAIEISRLLANMPTGFQRTLNIDRLRNLRFSEEVENRKAKQKEIFIQEMMPAKRDLSLSLSRCQ